MFLVSLPPIVRMILLAVVGVAIGAAINWAIYRWTYFLKRQISPWLPRDEKAQPRQILDYVPIVGWWGMRRDVSVHGKGFWIRPMLIELTWMIGLPLFFNWQAAGGLSNGGLTVANAPNVIEIWFYSHTILFALLTVATFIDFDERTIPDGVTITGLIVALLFAALAPTSRLPVLVSGVNDHLHFNTPLDITDWHLGWKGLALCLAIFFVWFFSLLPKTIYLEKYNFSRAFKILIGSIVRPKRKTSCAIRVKERRPHKLTFVVSLVFLAAVAGLVATWMLAPKLNVTSLFCAVLGMAVGGGMVWAIRIIASYVMQQEAMGFGDVTLMFMIGAFLGWQPSLLVFVLAPFSSLLIAVAYFLIRGDNKLAFGPYLCFGALLLIFFWQSMWAAVAFQFFGLGGKFLMIVGVCCLVLMAFMLFGLQILKSQFGPADEEI